VECGDIERAIAADAEVDARRTDQGLDPWLDQSGRRRRGDERNIVRQVLALRRVEYGEALQERNSLGFLAGLERAPLLVVGHEAVGVDDGRAALALADIAAERERLA